MHEEAKDDKHQIKTGKKKVHFEANLNDVSQDIDQAEKKTSVKKKKPSKKKSTQRSWSKNYADSESSLEP